MEVTAHGAIKAYRFYPAVMHSRARLTYTQVWAWLSEPATAKSAEAKALLPHLRDLYALFKALAAAREQARRDRLRNRRARDRVRRARQDHRDRPGAAQRRAQADRGMHARRQRLRRGLPDAAQASDAVSASTSAPPPEKLAALREFLATSALHLGGGDDPTAGRLREAPRAASRDRPDFDAACRPCCCARCRRRSTAPTTTATSASPTRRTRTSRRRSAAIPTCSCTARSRRASPASATRRPA